MCAFVKPPPPHPASTTRVTLWHPDTSLYPFTLTRVIVDSCVHGERSAHALAASRAPCAVAQGARQLCRQLTVAVTLNPRGARTPRSRSIRHSLSPRRASGMASGRKWCAHFAINHAHETSRSRLTEICRPPNGRDGHIVRLNRFAFVLCCTVFI